MRHIIALLVLLMMSCGAQAIEPNEPFGLLQHQPSDLTMFRLQAKFANDQDGAVKTIVEQVRAKPQEQWLTWANQFANLSGVGDCLPTAALKFQVLLALGYTRGDLRLVVGSETGYVDHHAVLAVRTADGWRVLDNRHLVPDHRALLDGQIKKSFTALYAFN